jgi:hypothetical protein
MEFIMTNSSNNTATVSADSNTASKNKRVGIFARHATRQAFYDAAEELQTAVEKGAISKDNVFYKWVTSPETLSSLDDLQPNDVAEPQLGFGHWTDEVQAKVKAVLNKRVSAGDYTKAETIAAYIAGASVPDYRTLDEAIQENHKAECLAWVRANTADDGIFLAKKGRGGGTTLRVSL